MEPDRRPTRGHVLFEEWLIATYGAGRKPGRPHFRGLRAVHTLLRREMKAIAAEADRSITEAVGAGVVLTTPKRAPKNPEDLYHLLASAKDSSRRTPLAHLRIALERITDGAVPRDAWDEPASESRAA